MAINLKPIEQNTVIVTIKSMGGSSLITHAWSEKARKEMLDRKQGIKTKAREKCVPEAEFEAAKYRTEDGRDGVPVSAIKNCIIGAAHKDIGIEKTLVRKSLFIVCEDTNGVIPIDYDKCVMREDYVRVGAGGTDLRYRPEYFGWSCEILLHIDSSAIPLEPLLNLINRAGFGVGICEWRPEKSGEHGRFMVDGEVEVIHI